jgi:hypothetical protein
MISVFHEANGWHYEIPQGKFHLRRSLVVPCRIGLFTTNRPEKEIIMKVAYIMSSTHSQKILNTMILPQLEQNRHGAEVLGIFFSWTTHFF